MFESQEQLVKEYAAFKEIRTDVLKVLESARTKLGLGRSAEAELKIGFSSNEGIYYDSFFAVSTELETVFGVALVSTASPQSFESNEFDPNIWATDKFTHSNGETIYVAVRSLANDENYQLCPRCKRYHEKKKMWYQTFDGTEYLVCDRCQKVLYFYGHTDDFGLRWWDKEVWLKQHPEKDTVTFRENIKNLETSWMLLDGKDSELLEAREKFEEERKEKDGQ